MYGVQYRHRVLRTPLNDIAYGVLRTDVNNDSLKASVLALNQIRSRRICASCTEYGIAFRHFSQSVYRHFSTSCTDYSISMSRYYVIRAPP